MKVGLNVGSGQRPFTSNPEVNWYNVDSQEKWHPDFCCDGANIPTADESADYFILHHCLEHYGLGEASGLIQEAHRVLKHGGRLLIFIPDVKALARKWLDGGINDYIFMVNMMGAYCGDEADRHRWHYTEQGLKEFLYNCAEWEKVIPFNWTVIPGSDFARDWWILAYEAVKG